MEPSEAVTWLMQMAREMSLEAQQWELFSVTWASLGFDFDANVRKRVKAHSRMLAVFSADLKKQVVPKGTRISVGDLGEWTLRLERLQKTHGQLMPAFRKEADRFGADFKDAGSQWQATDD